MSRSHPYYLLMSELLNRKETLQAWRAVTSAFLINGLVAGSFFSRVPDFKQSLELTNSQLGIALLFSAIGVLLALTVAGKITAKYGSAPTAFIATLALALALPVVALSFNLYFFCFALALQGGFLALQDVSMNTHAITLEQASGNRYMSKFHGIFSLGALAGGFLGGVFSEAGITLVQHALVILILIILITFIFKNSWLSASMDQQELSKEQHKRKPAIFWLVGLLGLCAAIGEGAAGDWGGILARDTFGASPFLSAMPYVVFSFTMVVGRLSGDYLAHKFGPARLITSGGVIAGAGLIIGLLVGGIVGVVIGWLALGLGLSTVIPMLFSEAGIIAKSKFENRYSPAEAIAMVSGIAYFGFLVGPPVIGFLADQLTLRWAMLLPGVLALVMAAVSASIFRSNK